MVCLLNLTAYDNRIEMLTVFFKTEDRFDLNKVVVLTGNNKVEDKLNEMQLNTDDITIVYKPVDFKELSDVLRKVLL